MLPSGCLFPTEVVWVLTDWMTFGQMKTSRLPHGLWIASSFKYLLYLWKWVCSVIIRPQNWLKLEPGGQARPIIIISRIFRLDIVCCPISSFHCARACPAKMSCSTKSQFHSDLCAPSTTRSWMESLLQFRLWSDRIIFVLCSSGVVGRLLSHLLRPCLDARPLNPVHKVQHFWIPIRNLSYFGKTSI